MKIYFNIDNDMLTLLTASLEVEGYKCMTDNHVSMGALDTEKKIFSLVELPVTTSYIIHIMCEEELDRFLRIVKGEELARFNSGKPEFSYIDFRLFKFLFHECIEPNKVHYSSKKNLYCLLDSASTLCFVEDTVRSKKALEDLQVFSYHLALWYEKVTVDPEESAIQLQAFTSMAAVLVHGAKKYERNNWRKKTSEKLSIVDSLDRHVKCLLENEEFDKESGFHHIGHVLCNVMFLLHQFN